MDIETLRNLDNSRPQWTHIRHKVKCGDLGLDDLAIDLDFLDGQISDAIVRYLDDGSTLDEPMFISATMGLELNTFYESAESDDERTNVKEYMDIWRHTVKLARAYSLLAGVPLLWLAHRKVVQNNLFEL